MRKKKSVEPADDALSKVCGYYESSAESTKDGRRDSERDRDFYDGIQATAEEAAILKARGQAVTIRNRVKPKIDSLLGMEREGRTDPRANPRTPMDDQAANACTDAIRFVCDEESFSQKRSEVFENILVEGAGGAIVEADGKGKIPIRYIPWDRMFADPHSRFRDYRDAKYKGIVVWMDEDDAKATWPDKAEPILESSWSMYDNTQTYDDKPVHQRWVDGKRKRVKVVELYYREAGTWMYCVYTKAGFLIEPQKSSYLDDEGEPTCPIEYISCHVDRENNRYGLVRQLIGPQIELNHRAWKALHRMTQQQTLAEKGGIENIQAWKKEQAKPNGVLEHNPGFNVEILKNSELTAFEMQMLAEAKGEIDSVGANAALQGKGEAESGKALQIRRASGVVEVGTAFDALHLWQQKIYKQIWNRIKQFWTAEKWVRVTDDERNIRFVGLNVIDPVTGQKMNDVSQMDVDIVLDDVPDVATAMQEEFTMLAEAYKANPQTPVNPMGIPFDIVIENSNLRNKQKILDRLNGTPPAPIPGPDGMPQEGPNVPPIAAPLAEGAMPEQPMPPPQEVMGALMQDAQNMMGQASQQAAMGLQQMAEQLGQQIMQGIQQASQEAVGAIQQAGQQTVQGIGQAGQEATLAIQQATLEAVGGVQQAAGQASAMVSSNAAANGIQAMMAGMNQSKQIVRDATGRAVGIVPVNGAGV